MHSLEYPAPAHSVDYTHPQLPLKSIETVLLNCTTLVGEEKMGVLACRLARESVFGEEMMAQCTVQGLRGNAAFPPKGVTLIRNTLIQHRFPMMASDSVTFRAI